MSTVTSGADGGLELLLSSREPAIKYAALTELLNRPTSDPDVRRAQAAIPTGPIVARLLAGPRDAHPYVLELPGRDAAG